jgi:hypothetical protein
LDSLMSVWIDRSCFSTISASNRQNKNSKYSLL